MKICNTKCNPSPPCGSVITYCACARLAIVATLSRIIQELHLVSKVTSENTCQRKYEGILVCFLDTNSLLSIFSPLFISRFEEVNMAKMETKLTAFLSLLTIIAIYWGKSK
jgi:hypothetical protein